MLATKKAFPEIIEKLLPKSGLYCQNRLNNSKLHGQCKGDWSWKVRLTSFKLCKIYCGFPVLACCYLLYVVTWACKGLTAYWDTTYNTFRVWYRCVKKYIVYFSMAMNSDGVFKRCEPKRGRWGCLRRVGGESGFQGPSLSLGGGSSVLCLQLPSPKTTLREASM